jgi:hypothetical protein
MRKSILSIFLAGLAGLPLAAAGRIEIVSVERIWNQAPYNSFGDILFAQGKWFCVFREGQKHAPRPGSEDNGKVRVIWSSDGDHWSSSALLAEEGVDLRDPHLSVTPDGRLMVVAGGSFYPGGIYKGRQSRVMFSRDGRNWTRPQPVLKPGHWLWRVTWYKGKAYGISKYGLSPSEPPDERRRQDLVTSSDGVHWQVITELKVPAGDESTVRFLADGRMVALVRRSLPSNNQAYIGVSKAPYQNWEWHAAGVFVGGPNFLVLPDGTMVAGGRYYVNGDRANAKTAVGFLQLDSYVPSLVLPSGGDSSYPGFFYKDGLLWTLYYSSHGGKSEIYLAKLRVTK